MPFSLRLPSALFAACLLLAAGRAAAEPEIPVYQDFSWPLSFTAASHGAEGGDEARAIREAAAIAHLAQEEDSWVDRYLFRPPAATANSFAAYQPPRAASADGPASVRDWLSGALGQGKSAAALLDVSSREAETGDWLSGDLAEMSRKREAKKSAEKERSLAEEAAKAQWEEEASIWNPADVSRLPEFSSADAAAGATNATPDSLRTNRGNVRTSRGNTSSGIDAVRQATGEWQSEEDGSKASEWIRSIAADTGAGAVLPAWREDSAPPPPSPSATAEKRETPAWMTAILDAGHATASGSALPSSWSIPDRMAPPTIPDRTQSFPSFTESGRTTEKLSPGTGSTWNAGLERESGTETSATRPGIGANPGPRAGTDTTAGRWSTPAMPAAGMRSGWNGGWGSRNSLSGSLSLPATPRIPAPPATRPSSPITTNALPRPAWY